MAAAAVLRPGPLGQPDIDYAPNLEKFTARTRRRAEMEKLDKTLPPGLPSHLESPLVWEGADIASIFNWVYELSSEEVDEIEAALAYFKCLSNLSQQVKYSS